MGEYPRTDWFPLKMDNVDELFIDLLREWFISATDGLVSIAGMDTSLALLRPYCLNCGEGGAPNLRKITGFNTDDVESLAWFVTRILHVACNQDKARIWSDKIDLAYTEVTECSIKGRNMVACLIFCDIIPQAGTNALNRDFEYEMVSSYIWGDETCRYKFNRINKKTSDLPLEEVVWPKPPREIYNFCSMAIFGELWVMVTKAVMDHGGTEAVSNVLIPIIYTSGQKFGKGLRHRCSELNIDTPSIHEIVIWLNRVTGRTGIYSEAGISSQGEIDDCPLSGSPPEICHQCQSFFNGICGSMDPSFEFVYDRMMTKGDETCHWVVRKKESLKKEKTGEEDEAIKTLRLLFARGEISKENFEEKMILLKKYDVDK